MTKELKKRLITSIILFILALLCILINYIVFSIAAVIVLFICFDEWCGINYRYFSRKKTPLIFNPYFFVKFLGAFYLVIVFYSSLKLRDEGAVFFIFILCICVLSDIGGYIFGKLIGGKRLTKISPNKTISGSAGSFIFSLLTLILFNYDLILKNLLFCLIVSLSCQLGDLIISYFKRLNKVKDTGNILPGHGGLLDRIDGIIFVIPVVYILKNYVGFF